MSVYNDSILALLCIFYVHVFQILGIVIQKLYSYTETGVFWDLYSIDLLDLYAFLC